MVATSNPLAAQAGLAILQQGGNAVDAAIAAASTLTVVAPTRCGLGGDLIAQVCVEGKLYTLNASGPAPSLMDISYFKKRNCDHVPQYGVLASCVPGLPKGWAELHRRFGKSSYFDLFRSSIDYAANGYPVTYTSAKAWAGIHQKYKNLLSGEEYFPWFDTFAPKGNTPEPGSIFKVRDLANTLKIIAESYSEDFYNGKLSQIISRFYDGYGGLLNAEDLRSYQPEWQESVSAEYRQYRVWTPPPNSQGLVALHALKILNGYAANTNSRAESIHLQIEALKIALKVGEISICDPRVNDANYNQILSEESISGDREKISTSFAGDFSAHIPGGGTVYVATADSDGNMVSLMQSNYWGFGSGIVVPGTGIAMNSRASAFSLQPEHSNSLAPGKRPYNTLMPSFISEGDRVIGPLGIIGAKMQPQGIVQLAVNLIDYGLNPQSALDAPRWEIDELGRLNFEKSTDPEIIAQLTKLGHSCRISESQALFGRGQIIHRSCEGVFTGGTEYRADGAISVF
ncbi:gamma-glutamyltransferase family protein [Pseudomonas syringae pv. syringae]|uniref:gamma-glutamyltransferase family protein n=1 Tax=Pseudomonas syringae TaxID=317 RepID=UPI002E7C13E3|nr:gamma-glutamyltransferase family protein [Pseudomonas syringae]MEE1991743.1 gamma-glutamyltransferase family protein [Pseudomonas syringae pv. syringae]MEE1996798.1 gamma-glutamyltransferase family protein [Pseudomonas syringae pv. syringae]